MLKRHMRIVHKIYSIKTNKAAAATPSPSTTTSTQTSSSTNSGSSNNVCVKEEAVETSDEDEDEDVESSPAPSPGDTTGTAKGASVAHNTLKMKEEEAPSSPKLATPLSSSSSRGSNSCNTGISAKMTKLSVGFDFKQLFCKLCKRQFSSRQNLTKHIELHTDGNDIFIKFYRCPLCRYESRRKRDVLRHVTVVHKKSSAYLAKIMPKLESRAVKRLAEVVLNSTNPSKRTSSNVKEEVNGRQASSSSSSSSSPSPPVTRKQECSAAPPSASSASTSSAQPPAPVTRKQQDFSSPPLPTSAPVTRKQERQQTHQPRPVSPPLTRRSEKHTHQRNSSSTTSPNNQTPHTRRHDAQSESSGAGSTSTEVRVTKNFSLHACDQCGRAFAKKVLDFNLPLKEKCFSMSNNSHQSNQRGERSNASAAVDKIIIITHTVSSGRILIKSAGVSPLTWTRVSIKLRNPFLMSTESQPSYTFGISYQDVFTVTSETNHFYLGFSNKRIPGPRK